MRGENEREKNIVEKIGGFYKKLFLSNYEEKIGKKRDDKIEIKYLFNFALNISCFVTHEISQILASISR